MEREQLILLAKEYFDDRDFLRSVVERKSSGSIFEKAYSLAEGYRLEVTIEYDLSYEYNEHSHGYYEESDYSLDDYHFGIIYQTFIIIDDDDNEIEVTDEMKLDERECDEWIYTMLTD